MTPKGVELAVRSEGKPPEPSLLMTDGEPALGAVRGSFQDIGRAEFHKQRKRLGEMSAEQEAAIEAFVIATVNKVSHRALAQMARLSETSGGEDFSHS